MMALGLWERQREAATPRPRRGNWLSLARSYRCRSQDKSNFISGISKCRSIRSGHGESPKGPLRFKKPSLRRHPMHGAT